MRIAISGASGTGKTTLATALAAHYQLPINPIGSRTVAKAMGYENPYDVDRDGKRFEFQEKLFEMKRAWEQEHEHFVTDRSYLDNLTYCALHMAERTTEEVVDYHMAAMDRYDVVLVLPAVRGLHRLDDGVRITNPMYHAIYDMLLQCFYTLLARLNPIRTVYVMSSASAEGRLAEAKAVIQGFDPPGAPE